MRSFFYRRVKIFSINCICYKNGSKYISGATSTFPDFVLSCNSNFARFINEANVMEINDVLALAYRDIGQNANGKIVFFDLALKMIVLLIRK